MSDSDHLDVTPDWEKLAEIIELLLSEVDEKDMGGLPADFEKENKP